MENANVNNQTYDMISKVGTKIVWSKTRDIAISYCTILLNDTLLNLMLTELESSACECGYHSETVEHFILSYNG